MKEYLEQQLKKKAHELVMVTFRVVSRSKGNKGVALTLRQTVSKIPVAIFEAQARQFDEDKTRYFNVARSSLFEARYYLDLLSTRGAISYYSYRQVASKIELLDKLLVSRTRSLDRQRVKGQYRSVFNEKYNI